MRKLTMAGVAATVGALVWASAAMGAVTFDPARGTGFVGNGDVQLVFGWNNNSATCGSCTRCGAWFLMFLTDSLGVRATTPPSWPRSAPSR